MTSAEPLIEGQWTILAVVRNGTCLAREYIDERLTTADKTKIWALLARIAEHGPPKNGQKFNHLTGSLYEFKSFQDRLPCFYDGPGRIVITHGCKKKKDRTPKNEIQRGLTLMTEYLEEKGR